MNAGDFDLVVDPTDGKGYYYFERVHSELICADLTEDYIDVTGYYSTHFPLVQPPYVREAPAYFARNGLHYLVTSGTTGYYPNPSEVAMAPSNHGPWTVLNDPHPDDPSRTSYQSQVSSVFRHPYKQDLYIALADRWLPHYTASSDAAITMHAERFRPQGGHHEGPWSELTEIDTSIADYVWLPFRFEGNTPSSTGTTNGASRTTHEQGDPTDTCRDQRLDPGRRADLLLAEMTTPEKCHQLTSRMPWSLVNADGTDAIGSEEVLRNPPGHVAQLIMDDPAQLASMVGTIQRQVLSRSRLGIPVLFHAEALSGFLAGGHMVFPVRHSAWPPGGARTWSRRWPTSSDAGCTRRLLFHALSPVLDVALDPRWGRVHETFGEDPYLCAALGVAYVRGIQGPDLRQGVMATGKHFLGYAV